MTAKEYQELVGPSLQNLLNGLEVVQEWTAFRKTPYQYSPRVDIAVGPFNVAPGQNRTNEYNLIVNGNQQFEEFITQVYECHISNIGEEWLNEIELPRLNVVKRKNQNARCLLAIEIENTSTKKHIMGSMVNAASLGRIGIGVAFNDSVLRSFIRIMNYMGFLKRVEKNTYDTTNFLIITKEQLLDILEIERQ